MSRAERPAQSREGAAWTRPQRIKNDLIYTAIAALLAIVTRLPRPVTRAICRFFGVLAFVALGEVRGRARSRLNAGLGLQASARRVLGAFMEVGALLADTIALLRPEERASRALSLDEASRGVFRGALSEGRGVVYISAHLGPWERMAALLVEEGFPVATVARESYDRRITALYERIRAPRGVRSIYRGGPGAPMAVARELAAGGAVGFLIDLPGRGLPFVPIRLFGEEAELPIGAARIALSRGAAVVVGACAPSGRAAPRVVITRIPTDDLAACASPERELHSRIVRALEDRIALWPDAWLGLFAPARLRRSSDHR